MGEAVIRFIHAADIHLDSPLTGLSAYSDRVTSSSGSAINRVRVGPFLQREDASNAQAKIKSSLGINGVVMSAD